MTLFIDDVSNPEGNHRAEQPMLELLRQLVEHRTVCALEKEKRGEMKIFENVQYVLAMSNISEGERTENISQRFLRHFFIYNVLPPSVTMVHEIYGQMLRGRFIEASTAMQSVVDCLPYFTEKLLSWLRVQMLPSPCKWHYTFSMGDLSKVFLGILKPDSLCGESSRSLLILWQHECERVFCDRLVNAEDKKKFTDQLVDCTREMLILISSTPPSSSLSSVLYSSTLPLSQRFSVGRNTGDTVKSSTSSSNSSTTSSSAPVPHVQSVPKQNRRNYTVRSTVTNTDVLPNMEELVLQEKVRKR